MKKKKVLLWIDLTLRRFEQNSTRYFEEFFTIRTSQRRTRLQNIEDKPDALCFDYDYPDRAGLELLQRTKQAHPSIPVLMLTVQHSEELAVWAFRARVWDYFAKPVAREDIKRCAKALSRIGDREQSRHAVRTTPPLPPENDIVRSNDGTTQLVPALEYVRSRVGEKITLKEVATLCGMSPYKFSRVFHRAMGETFQNFLLRTRISHACELLRNPNARIVDVAYLTGFQDASYFAKVFRRFYGVTPTFWQQSQVPGIEVPAPAPAPAQEPEAPLLEALTLPVSPH